MEYHKFYTQFSYGNENIKRKRDCCETATMEVRKKLKETTTINFDTVVTETKRMCEAQVSLFKKNGKYVNIEHFKKLLDRICTIARTFSLFDQVIYELLTALDQSKLQAKKAEVKCICKGTKCPYQEVFVHLKSSWLEESWFLWNLISKKENTTPIDENRIRYLVRSTEHYDKFVTTKKMLEEEIENFTKRVEQQNQEVKLQGEKLYKKYVEGLDKLGLLKECILCYESVHIDDMLSFPCHKDHVICFKCTPKFFADTFKKPCPFCKKESLWNPAKGRIEEQRKHDNLKEKGQSEWDILCSMLDSQEGSVDEEYSSNQN